MIVPATSERNFTPRFTAPVSPESTVAGVALLNSDSPGVTALVAPEAALEPAPFTAFTVNVYAVPAVRPVTRRSVALAPAGTGVCAVPPTDGVTV